MMYGINCDHICVENRTGTANLGFEMERIWKEGKQHDNADVTFRIVLTTDEKWQACSQSQFVVNSDMWLRVVRQSA